MRLLVGISLILVSHVTVAASTYVRRLETNQRVIVFVHGVTGNGVSTWTNSVTKAYWPMLLTQDKAFAGADIYVYEYPTPALGRSYNINELAEDLRLAMDDVVKTHREIIFVSHSMGGLIVRQYLLKYREVASKVSFMYFLATPTTGSPMATLASIFSRNPQLGNLQPMRADEYLANLQRDWLASGTLPLIPSYCAYEKRPTFSQMVVEQESATNLCNRPLDPIDANHIDIVKPASDDDKPYRAFKSAYLTSVASTAGPGLRAQIEDLHEDLALISGMPKSNSGESIYCDTIRLSLVLAHASNDKAPILINSISVDTKPIAAELLGVQGSCKVDLLSSHPHGIVEKNVYLVNVAAGAVSAKLIKDETTALTVNPNNILQAGVASRGISLKYDEEPIGVDVYIQTTSAVPQSLTFRIDYDQNGPHAVTTNRLIIWK